MFQTKFAEKIKTHISYSVTFVRKSCRLWENVEIFIAIRKVADNMARWMLHARQHTPVPVHPYTLTHAERARARTHTHTDKYVIVICFPGKNNSRTRLNVTLRVNCLSCLGLYCYGLSTFTLLSLLLNNINRQVCVCASVQELSFYAWSRYTS
jgi:hypothetical protein